MITDTKCWIISSNSSWNWQLPYFWKVSRSQFTQTLVSCNLVTKMLRGYQEIHRLILGIQRIKVSTATSVSRRGYHLVRPRYLLESLSGGVETTPTTCSLLLSVRSVGSSIYFESYTTGQDVQIGEYWNSAGFFFLITFRIPVQLLLILFFYTFNIFNKLNVYIS